MTITKLKKQFTKSKRNTEMSPFFEIDHENGMLAITEYLIGGTTCVHHYSKKGKEWAYDRTEA